MTALVVICGAIAIGALARVVVRRQPSRWELTDDPAAVYPTPDEDAIKRELFGGER